MEACWDWLESVVGLDGLAFEELVCEAELVASRCFQGCHRNSCVEHRQDICVRAIIRVAPY